MHWIGLYRMRYGLEPDGPYETNGPSEEELRRTTIDDVERSWVDLKNRLWRPVEPRSEFEDRLWRQYELFQFIDRMSIIMATRDMAESGEWSVGRVRLEDEWVEPILRANGEQGLTLDPFPFESEFTTSLVRRWIDDREYTSAEDLRDAYDSAEVESLEVRIAPR